MSDDMIRSKRGHEYSLKDALRRNPTIIAAGDDISYVALARIEELEAKLAKAEAAIHRITPYLSASLDELDCGPDYIDACNQVFEADSTTLAELTGETT